MSSAAGVRGTFTREELIEIAAALDAASTVISNHFYGDEEVLGGFVTAMSDRLVETPSDDEAAWYRDPTNVLIHARAAEIQVAMLEEYGSRLAARARREVDGRIAVCMAMAPRYRERGTADLPFQLADDAREEA